MRRASALLALVAILAGASCAAEPPPPIPPATIPVPPPPQPAPPPRTNPFFDKSPLTYEAPPFDRIRDDDYGPAILAGMSQQLAEVTAIVSQPDPPTFANTIVRIEQSGALLTRVERVFGAMTGANTNDALEKTQEEMAPKLAAHQDAIYLDARLYARVKAVYDARASLDPESRYLAERYRRDFVRAGAELSEAAKTELRAVNEEESSLETAFSQKLLAANKAGALILDGASDLAGESAADLAAAAEAAKDRHLDGKWVLTLQNTTQQPPQVSLQNRATREKLFRASTERAEHKDANDTRATVQRIAELRARKARLLGYPTWAAYVLADQMAETPQKAIKLLTDMAPASVAKARKEATRMQELASRDKPPVKLAPWDWQYYSDRVKKADYAVDDAETRPYFEIDRVLKDGVFFAANKLYGLTFQERHDLPVYDPDVRVFDVSGPDGKSIGLIYTDYWKRDNKNGGAWEDAFVEQSTLLGTRPVVYNVCNFTKPAPGQPALVSFSDVTAMFHEFGHALHGLLANVKYPALVDTPRDFVEFPSQFNEHWASEPTVFASYARHYQTGAPMPADLKKKIDRARKYGQGYDLTEYIAAALLDMAWHTVPDGTHVADVDAFEAAALHRYGVDFALVPPRYRTTYFSHIWSGGYSAGYYAYLWSEVLAHDAFEWFVEHGGMTRENGERFRAMILSRGHTDEMAPIYRAFRGRDPSVRPLLEHRGLVPEKAGGTK